MGLYRRYNPMNYRMMAFLSFFIPIARYIVVFTQRKRAAIDFEAYMRARREAFIRRQQQFNPYGNPYGNPYSSPYGTQNRQDEQGGQQEPEDPFAEFFDGEKSSDETKENDSQNGSGNHFGDGFDSFFQ